MSNHDNPFPSEGENGHPGSDDAHAFADRLRQVRRDRYGEAGASVIANEIGISLDDWLGYEHGTMMPGLILLRFLVVTGCDHRWLATGQGPMYRSDAP